MSSGILPELFIVKRFSVIDVRIGGKTWQISAFRGIFEIVKMLGYIIKLLGVIVKRYSR